MMEIVGIWIAALLTIAIMSFLFGDNPLYKFVEHIFVGTSAAFGVIFIFNQAIWPFIQDALISPYVFIKIMTLIAVLFGLLTWFRLEIMGYVAPNLYWIARFPIAFVTGIGTGIALVADIQGYIFPQTTATFLPLITPEANLIYIVSTLVLVVGVISSLYYFYFSSEQKGIAQRSLIKIGIIIIMITFGASFGFTIMGRISLLIGRIYFLLSDWLNIIG